LVGSLRKNDAECFLLGSVSEKVIRNAQVPVFVVDGKNPREE
jgi:nucleotide-binding universal stress UspA family protein